MSACIFEKVGEELISKFNYVAGMVPVIKAYNNEVSLWLKTVRYVFCIQIESVHNKAIDIKKADLAQKVTKTIKHYLTLYIII